MLAFLLVISVVCASNFPSRTAYKREVSLLSKQQEQVHPVGVKKGFNTSAYAPGSWLQMGSWYAPNYTGPTMTLSLFDGQTGQNYTSYLQGWTFSSFSLDKAAKRVVAVWYAVPQNYTASLSVYAYAPRKAPTLLSTCTLGAQGFWGSSAPVFVGKNLFLIGGNSVWSVTDYESGNCVTVPVGPVLQYEYTPFCNLAFDTATSTAYYIQGQQLISVSFLNISNPVITYQPIPAAAAGTWLVFGVDSNLCFLVLFSFFFSCVLLDLNLGSTSNLYLESTTSDYQESFWIISSSANGTFSWAQSRYWVSGTSPGMAFQIDSRYEQQAQVDDIIISVFLIFIFFFFEGPAALFY
jgi:hypothetical protein